MVNFHINKRVKENQSLSIICSIHSLLMITIKLLMGKKLSIMLNIVTKKESYGFSKRDALHGNFQIQRNSWNLNGNPEPNPNWDSMDIDLIYEVGCISLVVEFPLSKLQKRCSYILMHMYT